MQTSTQQTTEQTSDTARALLQQLQEQLQKAVAEHPELGPLETPSTDLQFTWPAKLILKGVAPLQRRVVLRLGAADQIQDGSNGSYEYCYRRIFWNMQVQRSRF